MTVWIYVVDGGEFDLVATVENGEVVEGDHGFVDSMFDGEVPDDEATVARAFQDAPAVSSTDFELEWDEPRPDWATEGERAAAGRRLQSVPDDAVSISDPSEAPEDASIIQGPGGGTYYIPGGGDVEGGSGGSETDARIDDIVSSDAADSEKKSELEGVVTDSTGVESVDLGGFDVEQSENAARAFAALGDAGQTDGLEAISATPSDEMQEHDAAGNYDPFSREIRFDPDSFTEEKAEEWGESGYLAGDDLNHVVAHEVGHHRHFQNEVDGQSAGMQAQTQEIPADAEQAFAEEVSVYAVKNPNEMVAELYAMQVHGEELTTGMENAYEEFGGPEVDV